MPLTFEEVLVIMGAAFLIFILLWWAERDGC
jgi:hypothetical protein